MSSDKKIEEAQFFLELLDALDQRKKPLTHSSDTAKEASYLYAAVLNSFYSVIAIMRDEENIDVKPFVSRHPVIYDRAKDGGERAKTIHVKHSDTAYSGYIPPKANEVNFDFRPTPLLIEEKKSEGLNIVLGPNHYMYIDLQGELIDVTKFCYDHFYELKNFHASTKT